MSGILDVFDRWNCTFLSLFYLSYLLALADNWIYGQEWSQDERDKSSDNWWFFTTIFYNPGAPRLTVATNACFLHFVKILKSNNN